MLACTPFSPSTSPGFPANLYADRWVWSIGVQSFRNKWLHSCRKHPPVKNASPHPSPMVLSSKAKPPHSLNNDDMQFLLSIVGSLAGEALGMMEWGDGPTA